MNHHYGWRTAFQVVALPGLLLVVIAMFTMRDPPRGLSDGQEAQKAPPLGEVVRYILKNKTLRQLIIGSTLVVTVGYGAIAWLPTYFVRVHAMTTIEVGQMLALLIGIGGGIGTALGGHFGDRLGKRDVRWNLWLIVILALIGLPFSIGAYLATDATLAIICWLFRSASGHFISGRLLPCCTRW